VGVKRAPNADGNPDKSVRDVEGLRNCVNNALSHNLNIFALLGAGENHGKFIAAQTGNRILLTNTGSKALRHAN